LNQHLLLRMLCIPDNVENRAQNPLPEESGGPRAKQKTADRRLLTATKHMRRLRAAAVLVQTNMFDSGDTERRNASFAIYPKLLSKVRHAKTRAARGSPLLGIFV
jgi:hypothetical protein